MRRPTVADLELPVTVWATSGAGFAVQPLHADRGLDDPPSPFWGRRDPLGLILRNDQPLHDDGFDARYILAVPRHGKVNDDGSWDAMVYLEELDAAWTARDLYRARGRKQVRTMRRWEVDLFTSENDARREQSRADELHEKYGPGGQP